MYFLFYICLKFDVGGLVYYVFWFFLECGIVFNVMIIFLVVVGSIFLIGIAFLVIWKLFVIIYDRREFVKF